MHKYSFGLIGLAMAVTSVSHLMAEEYVWLEGEKPASVNIKPNIAGWGNKQFLSGENWLHISIDAEKVDREVPGDGILLQYPFSIKKEGQYEIWNRVGFEFVRSPFMWRIDDGKWKTSGPEELTTDLMEISFFCEVAWLNLGKHDLSAGNHRLEIKLPKTKDDKGKRARILYALDAICIHRGPFHPNSRFKPDEDGRDEKDRQASQHLFEAPERNPDGARGTVALKGMWEICRHDEQMPGETAKAINDFPVEPHWKSIAVPGDKNTLRPDLVFAHRVWYRTRVKVPEDAAGRSFYLVFPQNNLNTTVYVNKIFCGFNKNPFARFEIDVSKGIKPGVNEIWVGIKDAWYGYSANPRDPLKLRRRFNLPKKFFNDGFQDLAYPVWNHPESGILVTPELVCSGRVYARDIFCKPSVAKKQLEVSLTLANNSAERIQAEITCEAVDAASGKIEKAFPTKSIEVGAGTETAVEISRSWENPKLWWPDEPNLYQLCTTVKVNGEVRDISQTLFGFREWTSEGKDFKLNGITWHGWCDQHAHQNKEEWLDFQRKAHQTTMRFWGTTWYDLSPDAALDFFDRKGVIVRRSGILDGEGIGYMAIETDPVLKALYHSEVKMDLMENWRDQVAAQVKGERNHPSVMVWSIENEWLFINCINLYGSMMDQFEAEVLKTSDAVRKVDPTRFTMTDGGGANKDNSMPVHGNHYVGPDDLTRYPERAYETNATGGGRGRWVWDQKRPRYTGEDFYAAGMNYFDYAYFGGEETFQGKMQSRPTVALLCKMLTEGYRWAEFGAWDLWLGQPEAEEYYVSNSPRAVFCRQWDWTFCACDKVKRTVGIFNDTRSSDVITFTWELSQGGKRVAGESSEHRVAPGGNEKFELILNMPQVKDRQEGELALILGVEGKEVFRDIKKISVLRTDLKPAGIAGLRDKDVALYDPKGSTQAFLKSLGIPHTLFNDLKILPADAPILIVGKDALDPAGSTSSNLAAHAARGHRVIILEQKNPLKYQGLPAEMEAATNEGRVAFGEDLDHPVLRGLKQKDFFTWGPDEIIYRNAYIKPSRGARSLIQCHERLQNSALAEIPVNNGLLLLCQLVIGEKLPKNAVAQRLLLNLIDYAAQYRLEHRPVSAAVGGDGQLAKVLEDIGLKYKKTETPLESLKAQGSIAIIAATPANLKMVSDHRQEIEQFTGSGGWIVLNGLTPEGLKDYNQIVGFDHMIRPFRRERVTLAVNRTPRMAGLTLSDVVMYSSEQIFPWAAGNFVSSDIFSHVVDYDDVAPFAKFPNDFLLNMVNGFVSADAWKYIVNVPAPEKPPLDWLLQLPKEQEIVEMEWIGNTFYYPVTKVELIFDGKETASFNTKPINDPQVFAVDPPRKGKDITLRLAEWQKVAEKAQVTGLDNIRLKAHRSADFYKRVRPILNVGGIVEYPQGNGGILLCNLLFKDREEVPINFTKKRTIFSTLLRNLKAPFSGGKTVIAGANLQYSPVDLSKQANQFRDERGWFGDKRFTFKDLPTGKQAFAGVTYNVYEFATSPVPTVIMLAGPGVPNSPGSEVKGIPVKRKADALFFLHTARIDQRMNPQEIKEKKKYEMVRYVVNYADGQKVNIPIYAEIDIDDYKQRSALAIPGAQVGWVRGYPGTDEVAVAYSKQWNNPRPEAEISSIDMIYGPDRRGVPALIAVTAAAVGQ